MSGTTTNDARAQADSTDVEHLENNRSVARVADVQRSFQRLSHNQIELDGICRVYLQQRLPSRVYLQQQALLPPSFATAASILVVVRPLVRFLGAFAAIGPVAPTVLVAVWVVIVTSLVLAANIALAIWTGVVLCKHAIVALFRLVLHVSVNANPTD
jgi:hypothetical protein